MEPEETQVSVKVENEGFICWYKEGTDEYHRTDGPAVEYVGTYQAWYQDGKRHRVDGPAVITQSSREWWVNGKRHRTDGPAIEFDDGTQAYFIDGVECSESAFKKILGA